MQRPPVPTKHNSQQLISANAALNSAGPQVRDGITRGPDAWKAATHPPPKNGLLGKERLHTCAKCIWSRTCGLSFPLKTTTTQKNPTMVAF